jgi:hypothetical protein
VIEAQNRGSLHLHILVWLEGEDYPSVSSLTDIRLLGALSPLAIQKKATDDAEFRQRLFAWLESIFEHNLPPDTVPSEGTRLQQTGCLLGRPPHPDSPNFDNIWPQYLRDVLDTSSQVHSHSETCFKNLPKSLRALKPSERDKLCRFNYPHDVALETTMDENGKITHKRLDGRVVGYNPTISGSFQCNTDGKFIGSGALGMALSIYMSNYTAKASLDSAIMMSALSAATKSYLMGSPLSKDEEHCRQLLVKTLNQINGRRELSAQQVASSLLGFRNHISDASFSVFYWSKLLTWLSPKEYSSYTPKVEKATSADSG